MTGYSRAIPAAEGSVEQQLQALRTQMRLMQEETEDMLRTLKTQLDSLQSSVTSMQEDIDDLEARVLSLELGNIYG